MRKIPINCECSNSILVDVPEVMDHPALGIKLRVSCDACNRILQVIIWEDSAVVKPIVAPFPRG
jgi:hypothetical protein